MGNETVTSTNLFLWVTDGVLAFRSAREGWIRHFLTACKVFATNAALIFIYRHVVTLSLLLQGASLKLLRLTIKE